MLLIGMQYTSLRFELIEKTSNSNVTARATLGLVNVGKKEKKGMELLCFPGLWRISGDCWSFSEVP
jgi:hypothetical protein